MEITEEEIELEKIIIKTDRKEDCSICLNRIGLRTIGTLQCGHRFHYECILKSFQTSQEHNNVCPYCRHTIERLPVVNGLKKSEIVINDKTFCIFGAGGAGMAIAFSLLKENIKKELKQNNNRFKNNQY